MDLTRRKFLTLVGGSAAGAVLFQACGVPEDELIVEAPVQMPEDMVTGIDNWYATLCPNCRSPEGIVVRVMEGRAKKVEGNVDYPVNQGKHGVRCEAALQGLYHPDRISAPLVRLGARGEGRWEEISWTDAIARLAHRLGQIEDRSSVVLATEPVGGHMGKVVQRFTSRTGVRHFRYDTLDETNLLISMHEVFGSGVMPDFDIGNTNYLLSFGADFLSTWGSPIRYARAYGRFRQGDRERGTHVHIEPRLSTTAASADEWVYVNPGWEGHVALAIASVIVEQGMGDSVMAAAITDDGAVDLARYSPERIADSAGVSAERIRRIADEFASHPPALAIGGGSAGAHSNGRGNLRAIYSLNHLVGSVGKPGGVIPNPGSPIRDVTGKANASSYRAWRGLADEMNAGDVSALLVHRANPVYGLPGAAGFRDALLGRSGDAFNVPLIVSFSGMMDDTSSLADLVLPENHGLEDWGDDIPTPGPGYQAFGIRQPVVRPFFEGRGVHLGTRNFADALMGVAQTMEIDLGLEGESFKEVLEAGVEGLFGRDRGSVRAHDFRSFWNGVLQRGGWWDTTATYSGPAPDPVRIVAELDEPTTGSGQFALVPYPSIGITDGRGAHLPWLQATPDPITTATWQTWVEINTGRAEEMGIKEGDVLRLSASNGKSIEALAYPHPGISPDVVSVPMGQGHTAGGQYENGRGANVLSILEPLEDAFSGALAWAATRVNVAKTGDWTRVPRFENTAPDLATDEDQHIIKLTAKDS